MHPLTRFAARLYPRWWRERYGEEFAALLEDTRPGLRGTFDVARAALALQSTTYSFRRVVFAGGLAGVAVACVVTLFLTPEVTSTGNLILMVRDTPENAPRILGSSFQPLASLALSRASLTRIIHNLELYKTERAQRPLKEVVAMMRRSISISMATRATNSTTIQIRFEYPDPRKALLTVEELTTALQRANQDMPETQIVSMRTALPAVVISSRPRNSLVMGLSLGLATGLVAASVLHFRRKRQGA